MIYIFYEYVLENIKYSNSLFKFIHILLAGIFPFCLEHVLLKKKKHIFW